MVIFIKGHFLEITIIVGSYRVMSIDYSSKDKCMTQIAAQ